MSLNKSKIETIECLDNVERLIIVRKRLNKKQYEFAREIGISSSYLLAIENYKKPLTKNLVTKINNYLKYKELE